MKLITKAQMTKLTKNAEVNATGEHTIDHKPVVKLFTPWANATWLLTEMDEEQGLAFGLCDLGMGCPELGYVSIPEITSLTGPAGLKVERDRYFTADKTLSEYADAAREAGYISA